MGLLRLLVLACACACAMGFAPAATPRTAVQLQRSASITMMPTASTKPQRVNARNRMRNKAAKSEMRTRIKTVLEAVKAGDYAAAQPVLNKAFAIIDKNVKRNIVHRNTAARKKSQLHLKVKALEGGAPAPAAATPAE